MKMNSDNTAGSFRGDISSRLFDAALIIFLAVQFIAMTAWYALNDSPVKVICYKAAMGLSCALCLAVIVISLIKRVYRLKDFIMLACFGAVTLASWYFSRTTLLLWMFLLIMAAYRQNARRIITISAAVTGAFLVCTILFSRIGILDDFIFDETTRVRHGLGYNWTTNAPTLLFFLGLQYIFLRREKMRFWEYIILEAANVCLYIVTDTSQPFFLMSAYLVFFFIEGLFRHHFRVLKHLDLLFIVLPAAACAVTLIIYLAYRPETGLWTSLNRFLNHRLEYGRQGFAAFGLTPFGQEIAWVGNGIASLPGSYNYVDCSYMQILFNYGAVFLAGAAFIYTVMEKNALKAQDHYLAVIIVLVLIHSFTEPRLFDMTFNILPVLAFAQISERSQENDA